MDIRKVVSELDETGFFIVKGICSDELPQISTLLGEIRVDPRSPDPIRAIRPQTTSKAKPNTLSSRYGTGSFPFHTDVAHWVEPARYVILYCEQPGSALRPTHLQDSQAWNLVDSNQRAALREVWRTGHFRPQLCTLGKLHGDRFLLRFDEACMQPMTAGASKLRDRIKHYIRISPIIDINWAPETLLIMDNHRILHARGKACRPDPDRVVKRVLIGR